MSLTSASLDTDTPGADVLYLSFDGMTDPLGRSQVLPYLAGLSRLGHRIRIVSLEKPDSWRVGGAAVEAICRDAGIGWHPLPYRSWPPILSGMANLRALRRAAERLHRQQPADFVHCRADLPAVAGLALKRRHGLPLLYDMRAFWPDERVEGGQWDQSRWIYRLVFRFFKKRQRELLADADEMVVLTSEARRIIADWKLRPPEKPITVIPCCADFEHFTLDRTRREETRARLGLPPNARVLAYLGSIGSWYLLGEMLDFFRVYRKRYPGAQFLFIAPSGEQAIRSAALERGVTDGIHVRAARREEVPSFLAAADLGISFIMPVFSKKASSPTKLGEMLAVGLPVVANAGVGDVAEIVRATNGGVAIDALDDAGYRAAIDALDELKGSPDERRQAARRWFDLSEGIALYDGIYRRLKERRSER